MEEEDLENNAFLKALKARCPDLYKTASTEQRVICVPSAATLHGLALNRSTFQSHIITASPFFAGIFETICGKTLDFEDSVLETKKGFPDKRKVKVLFEELHYNSDFKPFRVLCIEKPLQGGSPDAIDVARRPTTGLSECRTLDSCQKLMEGLKLRDMSPLSQNELRMHQRLKGGWAQARVAVADLFRSYVIAKGYLDHANSKLSAVFDSASNNLLEANRSTLDRLVPGEKSRAAWRRCVDTILMEEAHPKLIASLEKLFRDEDARVASAMQRKRNATPADLGADDRIQVGLEKAVELVKGLDDLKTPLDKISLLQDVANSINASVEEGKSRGLVPESLALSADELLPLLIFVLIQATPRRLYANAVLLSYFGGVGIGGSESGFHVANLMASADYLLSQGVAPAAGRATAGSNGSLAATPDQADAASFPGLFSPTSSGPSGDLDVAPKMAAMSVGGALPRPSGEGAVVETKGGAGGRAALLEGVKGGRRDGGSSRAGGFGAHVGSDTGEGGAGEAEGGGRKARGGVGRPPAVIAREEEDAGGLGDFLTALRSEDSATSSGRGFPF